MFQNILTALDNSDYSDYGMELAVTLGRTYKAKVTGCHVYAAKLHETRFMDMESGLPERYQSEDVLKKQRDIHDTLISKGLEVISDSYLDRFEKRCRVTGVDFARKSREGKNFVEIIKEADEGDYDLAVMGFLGLGEVESSVIGGVCERAIRKIRKDMLIVKKNVPIKGRIIVAVDGSPYSYWGLTVAIGFKKAFGCDIEAVSVFDPFFHQVAFKNIANVLSDAASQVFKFKEQEKLHEELIDDGMAKLYKGYLTMAERVAAGRGVEIKTRLLSGKPFDEILKVVRSEEPSLLVVGRFGMHHVPESDMGSHAENLLRLAPCNVYIGSRGMAPEIIETYTETVPPMDWTDEARARMEKVPPFARKMAEKAIQDYAREHGYDKVTEEVVSEATGRLLPTMIGKRKEDK